MAGITITKENFGSEVLSSELPVLLDFWAAWCGPCLRVGPIVEEIAQEYEGKIKVGKINVDEQGELAAEYGIMSIPTLMAFKDGAAVETAVGIRSKKDLLKMFGF